MLFRRGQFLAVRDEASGKILTLQWNRPFQAIGFELRRTAAEPVRNYLLAANAIVEEGKHSQELRNQLRRAMHWIGTSMTRENHDDKVTDLCTALETLLTVRSDGRKGEAISLRYMLLSTAIDDGFTDPTELLRLYELRSEIVHGSRFRVASRRDYSLLLWIATTVFSQYVQFVTKNPRVTSRAKFIDTLETSDGLSAAIAWLKRAGLREKSPLIKLARERLAMTHAQKTGQN